MTNIAHHNHETLQRIISEIAVFAPIYQGHEDIAICAIENLHYNEQNGKIVHPPAPGVVSNVNIEVEYERAGNSNAGFWIPNMKFDVKRPVKEDSWDEPLPFGAYQGDVVLRDSVNKFLWIEVNRRDG